MLEDYKRMLENAKKTEEIRERFTKHLLTEVRMQLNYLEVKQKMKGV